MCYLIPRLLRLLESNEDFQEDTGSSCCMVSCIHQCPSENSYEDPMAYSASTKELARPPKKGSSNRSSPSAGCMSVDFEHKLPR